MLLFARTLKEIPKAASSPSFDQETIPGGGKQPKKTHNRYLGNNCPQYSSRLMSEVVEQVLDSHVGSETDIATQICHSALMCLNFLGVILL